MEQDSRSIVLRLRQKLGGQESRATAQKHSSTGTCHTLRLIGRLFLTHSTFTVEFAMNFFEQNRGYMSKSSGGSKR